MADHLLVQAVSRRRFLRAAVAGFGAAVLSACGRATEPPPTATPVPVPTATVTPEPSATTIPTPLPTAPPPAQIEITTSGWPVDVFTRSEAAANPAANATTGAVQSWLDAHPGVRLVKVGVNIWDPAAIQAQVAAGTECTYVFGPALGGGWDRSQAVDAFQQGRIADVTGLVESARLRERILPDLWANWSAHSQVDGRYFAFPLNEFEPAVPVFIYRKDLLIKKRLPLPAPGWTWTEAAETFQTLTDPSQKCFGLVAPPEFLRRYLALHGADILTWVPAPETAAGWTRDWSDPRWVELIDAFRRLVHNKRALRIDPGIGGESDWIERFRSGESAFAQLTYAALFGDPADPQSMPALAEQKITTFDDLFGLVPAPVGDGYQQGGEPLWGPLSFGPNQSADQLALSADLVDWMFFGEGLDQVRAALWKATNDPRAVFRRFLYLDGRDGYNGVPARPADVWGESMVEGWRRIAGFPVEPKRSDYFGQSNPLPPEQPLDEQFLAMVSDPKRMNVAEKLRQGQERWQSGAAGYPKGLEEAEFRSAARAYYSELGKYLQEQVPQFYQDFYNPYYAKKIFPLIS